MHTRVAMPRRVYGPERDEVLATRARVRSAVLAAARVLLGDVRGRRAMRRLRELTCLPASRYQTWRAQKVPANRTTEVVADELRFALQGEIADQEQRLAKMREALAELSEVRTLARLDKRLEDLERFPVDLSLPPLRGERWKERRMAGH